MSSGPTVGVLIPTLNRSTFVLRQLTYYADVGCAHSIYVGDSSGPEEAARLREGIARMSARLRVQYWHLPDATDYGAIAAVCREVREPYVAFTGDDDFFVPRALDRCAAFLEDHPDYASAHGKAILLRVDSGREYGEVVGASRYMQRPVEEESARLRVRELLGRYWTICFSVQRRDEYLAAVEETATIPDKAFRELLPSCLAVARGKAKELDCLYLIRQTHQGRYLLPDAYDWVTGASWHLSYVAFERRIAAAIARQDGIPLDVAAHVMKQAFWDYLSGVLVHDRSHRPRPKQEGVLRARARRIPLARAVWRALRSFRAANHDPLSLSELLHPSSPYHRDFMTVYCTVLSLPVEAATTTTAVRTDAAHA